MNVRHGLAVLGISIPLLIMGTAPAVAAPSLPPGCSFDQSTGVQTCISTTTAETFVGPFTSGRVPASTTFSRVTGVQICAGAFGDTPAAVEVELIDFSFTETVVTTTTSQRHGVRGKVFSTETTSQATFGPYRLGTLTCHF